MFCSCCDERERFCIGGCDCTFLYCAICLCCSAHCRCRAPQWADVAEELEAEADEPVIMPRSE